MFSSGGIFAQTLLPKMDVCGNCASVRKVELSQALCGSNGSEFCIANIPDKNVKIVLTVFDGRKRK